MICKILIVDDNALVRSALRSCIEQNPRVVVCGEAENGQRAVEKFKELNPDVVILDWQMPVMGGLEAARRIALIAPQATLALFTLHSCEELVRQAQAVGVQRVFSKAENLTYLATWLTTVCTGA